MKDFEELKYAVELLNIKRRTYDSNIKWIKELEEVPYAERNEKWERVYNTCKRHKDHAMNEMYEIHNDINKFTLLIARGE